MSDTEDSESCSTVVLSSDESEASGDGADEASSVQEEEDGSREASPLDLLSDEVLLHILSFLDFWSREQVRTLSRRLHRLIDGEVRCLCINREWVTRTFAGRRFAYLRRSNKNAAGYLPPEERQLIKERLITRYITRHPGLKALSLFNCGMTLLHHSKSFRSHFTRKLAAKCPVMEDFLVCGSTGMRILLDYLTALGVLGREPRLHTLRVNPYLASGILAGYLAKALSLAPQLRRLHLFATPYEGVTQTALMKHEYKMHAFLDACAAHGISSLITCFRTDRAFKESAVQRMAPLIHLCLSGQEENEFQPEDRPFDAAFMESLVTRHANSLSCLKIFLDASACELLSRLTKLHRLALVLPRIDACCMHAMLPSLEVLSLTFLSERRRNSESGDSERQALHLQLTRCPRLEVLAVSVPIGEQVTPADVVRIASRAKLLHLKDLYFSGRSEGDTEAECQASLATAFVACPVLLRIFAGKRALLRSDARFVPYSDPEARDEPLLTMQRQLFCF